MTAFQRFPDHLDRHATRRAPNCRPTPPSRRSLSSHAAIFVLAAVLFPGTLGANSSEGPMPDGYARFVASDGSFIFSPEKLRDLGHLGSWFVPTGDAAGFHHVYTHPEAIVHFRVTGEFPDGTALVKEIADHTRANYTTGGNVASATQAKQWFLMIKDTKGRFPENPLWGKGWGWALFMSDEPSKNVATNFEVDCLGCHVPARRSDWVYTEGYPILKGAPALPSQEPPAE